MSAHWKHAFGVERRTVDKGNFSASCPHAGNLLWSRTDQGKCQVVHHFVTAMGNGCASDGPGEAFLPLAKKQSEQMWKAFFE